MNSLFRSHSNRHGVVGVETAIVLGTFLTVVLLMLDLGLAVLRYNTISEAARRLARQAIVHGDMAPPEKAMWGPTPYHGTAGDGSQVAQTVRSILVTMEPELVTIEIQWPDGNNRPDDRVQVTLSYPHQSMLPFILAGSPITLTAVSTMYIAH